MKQIHQLPPLPYPLEVLEPDISRETLEYHHGKHHAAYVMKLNGLIENSEYATMSLDDIVMQASGAIFNNAAQAWNHAFYWQCLAPAGAATPDNEVTRAIAGAFSSLEVFREQFTAMAVGLFGSGWVWLVHHPGGSSGLLSTANADNPLRDGAIPLLTCDVWEHAYYIDYRNSRSDYLRAFWKHIDWNFVNNQYLKARGEQER